MSRRHPLRVLLLTRFYPPAPEVGGLRPAKLVRALRAAGHEVTVVTAVPPAATRPESKGASADRSPSASGVRIVRVQPHLGPRQWLVKGKRLLRGGATAEAANGNAPNSSPPASAQGAADDSLATRLRAWVLSYAWLPDDHQGFIIPAVRATLDEAERASYDVIVATAPPFSTHLAGVVASSLTGIPLVVEFRDPWNYGDEPLPHLHASADRLNRWLERTCLRHAQEVVAVTEQTGVLLAEHRDALGKSAPLVIRNGIDVVRALPSGIRGDAPVRVVYVGELYGGRDPRPFLHSLARLRDAGALPPEGIHVDFVGECEVYAGTSVRELLHELALEPMVQLRGRIPHAESLALQRDADVLLLLAQRQPMQVPNKLYEYLGVGRPILAYVDAQGESADMLRRVGGHFLITPDVAGAEDATVRAALHAPQAAWAPQHPTLLHEWSADVQFARYVAMLAERFARRR